MGCVCSTWSGLELAGGTGGVGLSSEAFKRGWASVWFQGPTLCRLRGNSSGVRRSPSGELKGPAAWGNEGGNAEARRIETEAAAELGREGSRAANITGHAHEGATSRVQGGAGQAESDESRVGASLLPALVCPVPVVPRGRSRGGAFGRGLGSKPYLLAPRPPVTRPIYGRSLLLLLGGGGGAGRGPSGLPPSEGLRSGCFRPMLSFYRRLPGCFATGMRLDAITSATVLQSNHGKVLCSYLEETVRKHVV